MIRHGLQRGVSRGYEWGMYSWNEPNAIVVSRAKAELTGWKMTSLDGLVRNVEEVYFDDGHGNTISIVACNLPAPGDFSRAILQDGILVANPNSVVVVVTQRLSDGAYQFARAKKFGHSP